MSYKEWRDGHYHTTDYIANRVVSEIVQSAARVIQGAITTEIILFNEEDPTLTDDDRREHIRRTRVLTDLRTQIEEVGTWWPNES